MMTMARSQALFICKGGSVMLPDDGLVFVDRSDGGHLIVNPPRDVWERAELTAEELSDWSSLVAATGHAMLHTLPQLDGGCVNYFEAGNWALNDAAEPRGRKAPRAHRSVHLHLFGRSPTAADPSWKWGEAPRFPEFKDRHAWAASRKRLTEAECARVLARIADVLRSRYGMNA
jgi:diadenosine tetraphosphate (Ap4A) HIT family hydrolase